MLEQESDYGIMFAWGQTDNAVATKFVDSENYPYNWVSYEYCNGSYDTLTKYCTDSSYGTVDNITTLDPEDDAATQIMGSEWRMPTKAEFNELLSGTTNEWVTNYKGTGVSGRKFTSRANGNSIFIPAAGYCNDGLVYNVDNDGYVWSSSLDTSYLYGAGYLYFGSDDCRMYCSYRCIGESVRGVMD